MMPSDALYVDEVDLSNPDFMSTAINRLDASPWKLQTYLSTPTVPNYGINALYNASDMREWLVKCPKCNHEQPLDWEVNLRIVGAANNPTKVFYGCTQCNAEISIEHIQAGRWVAQHPELSIETVGYHIHQMLTTPAPILYRLFRDPQQKLVEFYRKRLGKPYEIGGGSVERDDILANCFDDPYDFEPMSDGKAIYYLGADQGNEIQVLIVKLEPHSRRPKIVHIELVPMARGFDRVAQLIEIFKIKRAVIDANPNRHEAINLVKRFPGRVLIADYIEEQKQLFIAKKGMTEFPSLLTNVTINRTTGFDGLMESIKKGEWQIPGFLPNLHPDVELLIDHTTALKRDIETRRKQSGEVQVAVWRKLRADHLAHAWLYLKTAIEVDRGRSLKIAVINPKEKQGEDEQTEEEYKPDSQAIVEITSELAEVPRDQLIEFLENGPDYDIPFPLSHKYGLIKDKFIHQDIAWVAQSLVNQKKGGK